MRRVLARGFSLIHVALYGSERLPAAPQIVEQHLRRMRWQESAAMLSARNEACREALLRDVEPRAPLRAGE
jgi:hypothetical protein